VNNYVYRIVIFALLSVFLIQCVGPIYYNKRSRVDVPKPTIYLLPSSYVGRLCYLEEKKSDGEKHTVMNSVAFDEWESFNVYVHIVFRKQCGKHGIGVEVMSAVHPGFEAMIACDSTTEYASDYLSLNKIYGSDSSEDLAGMNPGIIVVFTEFYFVRLLQIMMAGAKYYVYALPSRDLVLVDEIDKAYTMKAVRNRILSNIGQHDRRSVIAERMYGLWYDERDAYVEVCSLFVDEIIDRIVKKCLRR
jgi:hypothetical protein